METTLFRGVGGGGSAGEAGIDGFRSGNCGVTFSS